MPMKFIPAGVSKTSGKSYQGFYACEDRTHKQPKTYNHAPVSAAHQNPVRTEPKPDWDEIGRGKVRHAFWLELFKHQLSKGDYDKQIEAKQMSGVIGVYVEKVMGEGKGATAEELFPTPSQELGIDLGQIKL
jgi:hypothetical protein